MYNYRDTGTLMISFNFLMLNFTEMSDHHPIASSPIIIKYKYKLANREAISFN